MINRRLDLASYLTEADQSRALRMAEQKTSSPTTVDGIVLQALGKHAVDALRIVRGEKNEVYKIDLENEEEVILRISHEGTPESFVNEAWVMQRAAEVGLPTAEVLALGEFATEHAMLNFCIQGKLEGVSFDEMLFGDTRLAEGESRYVAEQIGEALAQLHTIKTEGYGSLWKPGIGRYESIQEQHRERIIALAPLFEQALEQHKGLRMPPLRRMLEVLRELQPLLEGDTHLVYKDCAPKHVLVDPETHKVTGFIDLEEAGSSISVEDFTEWKFWYDRDVPLDWVLEGYKRNAELDTAFDQRFLAAEYRNLLSAFLYCAVIKPRPEYATRAGLAIKDFISKWDRSALFFE